MKENLQQLHVYINSLNYLTLGMVNFTLNGTLTAKQSTGCTVQV